MCRALYPLRHGDTTTLQSRFTPTPTPQATPHSSPKFGLYRFFNIFLQNAYLLTWRIWRILKTPCILLVSGTSPTVKEPTRERPGAKTIKKNTNSTQNQSQTHRVKQYEITSFLSTDCDLSTETCSKNVYSLGPRSMKTMLCHGCKKSFTYLQETDSQPQTKRCRYEETY